MAVRDDIKPRLTHIARPTRDLDATIRFYRDLVGLSVVHEREEDGIRVVWLGEKPRRNDFVIVYIGVPPESPPKSHFADHLGYDLPSAAQVDEVAARAEAMGILEVPATDGGKIIGYYCMVKDPDGNLVEFSHGQPIDVD